MKRVVLTCMMLALPLAAQQNKPDAPQVGVQKVFILKYADPRTVESVLRIFNVAITSNPDIHALAVNAASSIMPAIEEAIARLDIPSAGPRNLEMTSYFLIGGESESFSGLAAPKELDSVVTQLKNTFPFKNYRLMDVLYLRTRTGLKASTNSSGGAIQVGGVQQPILTSLSINSASVAADNTTIRIDGLRASTRIPVPTGGPNSNSFSYSDLGINTDIDIKEGQKVVVGRVGISHDQALFLVLIAKTLN